MNFLKLVFKDLLSKEIMPVLQNDCANLPAAVPSVLALCRDRASSLPRKKASRFVNQHNWKLISMLCLFCFQMVSCKIESSSDRQKPEIGALFTLLYPSTGKVSVLRLERLGNGFTFQGECLDRFTSGTPESYYQTVVVPSLVPNFRAGSVMTTFCSQVDMSTSRVDSIGAFTANVSSCGPQTFVCPEKAIRSLGF